MMRIPWHDTSQSRWNRSARMRCLQAIDSLRHVMRSRLAPAFDHSSERATSAFVRVRGAREHDLNEIDVDTPRDALVVFSEMSGSGKPSLAFGTLLKSSVGARRRKRRIEIGQDVFHPERRF